MQDKRVVHIQRLEGGAFAVGYGQKPPPKGQIDCSSRLSGAAMHCTTVDQALREAKILLEDTDAE